LSFQVLSKNANISNETDEHYYNSQLFKSESRTNKSVTSPTQQIFQPQHSAGMLDKESNSDLNAISSLHNFNTMSIYSEKDEDNEESTCPCQRSITESLLETDEGTETASMNSTNTQSTAPMSTGGCSVTGSFSSIPSGTLAATLSGTKLGASFSMIGDFTPSIPCTCACGEYRQQVRGSFTRNGSPVTHALCGTNLSATTFQEDCGIFGGTTYKYGYRSISFANSRFTPDQAGGCKFEGFDFPGISGSSGDTLSINLDFTGKLIDTCNGNTQLASSSWSVSGTATVP
jgi:hypothetical protein